MLRPGALDLELDAPLSAFARKGYARLGPVLAPDAAQQLAQRADALMLGEIRYPGLFFQHDSPTGHYRDLAFGDGWVGPSRRYRKLEKLELDPLFTAWIDRVFWGLISPEPVRMRRRAHGSRSRHRR